MNPFLMDPKGRLGNWKEFRKSLTLLSEIEQLRAVADYWSKAPLGTMVYDIENSDTILSPWEMMSANDWCRNSVAIGMEFTLRLSGWDSTRMKLRLLRDWDLSEMILILIIDDQHVLNYSYNEVIEYPRSRHDIQGNWSFSGKFYAPDLN